MQNKNQPRWVIADIEHLLWLATISAFYMYLVTESSQQTQYLGILILGTATPISQMRIRRLNDATKVTRKVGAEQESESGCRFWVCNSYTTVSLLVYPRSFWSSLLALSYKIPSENIPITEKKKKKSSDLFITISCMVNPSQPTYCPGKMSSQEPYFAWPTQHLTPPKWSGLPIYTQLTPVYVTFLAL